MVGHRTRAYGGVFATSTTTKFGIITLTKNFAERLVILIVSNIISRPVPTNFVYFSFFLRVYNRHHTVVKLRIRLDKIDDMKNVLTILSSIRNLEIEPLRVIFSVVIGFQNQFVLALVYLYSFFQIARFKTRLKNKNVIFVSQIFLRVSILGDVAIVRDVPRFELLEISILLAEFGVL